MNKIISGIVIAIIAVLGLFGVLRHSGQTKLIGDSSTSFQNGLIVGGGVYAVSPALSVLGSQSLNGIVTTSSRQAIVSGTTTPCAILVTATSSINLFSFIPTVGTTTSSTFYLATSTTAFATTSNIATISNYLPTTALTWDPGTNNSVVFPGTYVVAALAASTATGGHVMTGFCGLTLTQL